MPAGALTAEPGASDDEVPEGELFVADITEVVITALDDAGTMLVIDSWTPTRGLRRVERT